MAYALTAAQAHVAKTQKNLSCIQCYAIVEAFILSRPIERLHVLEQLRHLIVRNDIFRAHFSDDGSNIVLFPEKHINELSDLAIKELEHDIESDEGWINLLISHRESLERKKYDLTNELMLRLVIVKSGSQCAILISMHHAFFDGWSFQKFVLDLFGNIFLDAGSPKQLKRAKGGKLDSILHLLEKEVAQTSDQDRLDFWRHALSPLSPAPPAQQLRTAGSYKSQLIPISGSFARRIRKLAAAEQIPIPALFLDAALQSMGAYLNIRECGVSTVHINRDTSKDLIAFGEFAQWVPIPPELYCSAQSIARPSRQRVLWDGIIAASGKRLPYWWLASALYPELIGARYGLTRVLFNYVPMHDRLDRFSEIARWCNEPTRTPVWAIPDFYVHVVDLASEFQIIYRVNEQSEDELPTEHFISEMIKNLEEWSYISSEVNENA